MIPQQYKMVVLGPVRIFRKKKKFSFSLLLASVKQKVIKKKNEC